MHRYRAGADAVSGAAGRGSILTALRLWRGYETLPRSISQWERPVPATGFEKKTEGALAQRHAFISYVRENSDVVDRLANELRNSGVPVWLDRNDIELGIPWKDAIKNAIQRGEFFIACFSKEANAREKTHMREEITIAIDELRLRPSDKSWFVPVLLNESVIPPQRISSVLDLSDIQRVELYNDWNAGLQKLLRAMKKDDP